MTTFSGINCSMENTVSCTASVENMKNCTGAQQDSLIDRPIGVRMTEAEDNSFDVALLSGRILSSLCIQSEIETPKRSSDTMKECADNLYGNTKLAINILKKILRIIGADE